MARASIVLVPLIRLLMPMGSVGAVGAAVQVVGAAEARNQGHSTYV